MDIEQIELGLRAPIYYRPQSSDREIIESVLVKRQEYIVPDCKPQIVFDVGAHIGSAAVLFAISYPNTPIYSFEPDPENFKLLCKNVEMYKNVKAFNFALGNRTEKRKFFASDNPLNTGGSSLTNLGVDLNKSSEILVVDILEFMQTTSIKKIDFMKIDVEGAEFEILKALKDGRKLPDCIVGEAHGLRDFEMHQFLSETHELGIAKPFGQRCYPFFAARVGVLK